MSNDNTFSGLHTIVDLERPENMITVEQSSGGNEENSSSSGERNRRSVSADLSDAKGKRRMGECLRRGTDFAGESSTPGQPPKTFAELIKHKSVGRSATLLINRINNRSKTVRNLQLEAIRQREQIRTPSPRLAELEKFNKDMDDMEAEIVRVKQDVSSTRVACKKRKLTEVQAKQRLIEIEDREMKKFLQDVQDARERLGPMRQDMEDANKRLGKMKQGMEDALKELGPMRQECGEKAKRANKLVNEILEAEDCNDEALRKKVSDELSLEEQLKLTDFYLKEKIDEVKKLESEKKTLKSEVEVLQNKNQELTKQRGIYKSSADQDEGCEDLLSKFKKLENQVYANNNNKVGIQNFEGLQQALDDTTGGKIPADLELIVTRIENDRGEATDDFCSSIQVLVCAAIREMEDSNQFWHLEFLKKWAATLNKAKELRFQVGFADRLLETKLHAYFATYLYNVAQAYCDKDVSSKFDDLYSQVYASNNKVGNQDFKGLQQELDNTAERKVPDYLELIAIRIEKDHGLATDDSNFSNQVLVCAAIKEMEDSVEFGNRELLLKWAATLNQAKNSGFRVEFADKLLDAKVHAYLAATELSKASR